MRPLIGVTTSEVRLAEQVEQTEHSDPPRQEMALGLTYMRAVERAGGIPVVIPPLEPDAVLSLLESVDGVVLSGGPDIDPAIYGQSRHPALGPTWRDLDVTELGLARHAVDADLPLLAICRGAQALNVARGGTLFQHVPEQFGRSVEHEQRGPGTRIAHTVRIEEGSVLASAVGATSLEVNSYHHQAPSGLGRGLRAVAWAPDGLIEGVEVPDREFVVGVQWHAEAMDDASSANLFRSFVEVAAGDEVADPAAQPASSS